MPELDGYDTLAAMKADESIRHLPVLIVSGVEELDSVVRCIELGATDYLTKPINPRILQARLNASLAAKHIRDLELEYVEQQRALTQTIERQKTELSRFLSPQVSALISSPDGEGMLAGHRRQITVAFCDLRGFTAFAEQADPEELFGVLGEYHAMMGATITEHGGTLEHFAGDGVMIFFNDPIPQDDHVARAVRMAVDMRARFAPLAAAWAKRGYELGFGVGIATGYATLGRIGFEGRYDYGAIGNVVILASRLSSQAGPNQILLSQRAHAMVEDLVEAESVGELDIKGLSRPVAASNVLATSDSGRP
jgi:class 3 adenylate cyclase